MYNQKSFTTYSPRPEILTTADSTLRSSFFLQQQNSIPRVMTARKMPTKMTMKTPPMLWMEIPPVSSSSSSQVYLEKLFKEISFYLLHQKYIFRIVHLQLCQGSDSTTSPSFPQAFSDLVISRYCKFIMRSMHVFTKFLIFSLTHH